MANPVVSLLTSGVASGGLANRKPLQAVAIIPFSVAFSSTTYATASGGITIDLTGLIRTATNTLSSISGYYGAAASENQSTRYQLEWAEVIGAFGYYSGGDTVIPTKTTTYGQFTVRLFNGESETGDGAKTGTLTFFVLALVGATNYSAT